MEQEKVLVKDFWNNASCGEDLYMKGDTEKEKFQSQLQERYRLEPFIFDFADFESAKNKKVLEIGVGLGADHQMFAEHGALLEGCDLTPRAIEYTKNRFELFGLQSELKTADAENLSYEDNSFDIVYSYGVIHHSPSTAKAAKEVFRVLKKGGKAKIMIYNKYAMVGYMLWIRYALLKGKPWLSLEYIYANYLESPGTKAYTATEAKKMFEEFEHVSASTILSHGDLLSSQAGQRHKGPLLNIARKIYPRFLIKKLFSNHGLFLFIDATK